MNILFFTHAEPKFLPPVIIDDGECTCGPNYRNWRDGGHWRSLHTPRGAFDAAPILAKLLPNQKPGLILVHADATCGCLPQNLPSKARKVLLVGDTHHLGKPLQSLLAYATSGSFEAIILWNRQHAHFFKQFGHPHVYWMPGLTFAIPPVNTFEERRKQICFFGQMGSYHPRRTRMIKELQQRKVPLVGGTMPRRDALELAARSLVSLNISLNGEFNLRVFESTATGAMLLTDELAPHTGLNYFYQDGESMLTFRDTASLIEQVQRISKDPKLAQSIAARGRAITEQFFSFEARRDAFFALLNGDDAPDAFRLLDEPRCQLPPVEPPYRDSLIFRVQLYEFLQELHRTSESISISLTAGVHPLLLSDASDLIRLHQSLFIEPDEFASSWAPAMRELQVHNLSTHTPATLTEVKADILLTTIEELRDERMQRYLQTNQNQHLVITDWFTDPDQAIEQLLRNAGFISHKEKVFGLFQKTS
jgi:hypothetical protein